MPKYKVTVTAEKVINLSQTIEVEANNKTHAKLLARAIIDVGNIPIIAYEEVDSYYCEERIRKVEE